jgi:L-ascorbate metabolism protein UlaG (beta-lactamase superfamily)
MLDHDGLRLGWLGYATVRVATPETVVYLDPGRYGVLDAIDAGDGDVVCVTHDHHYDPDGIRAVAADDADLVLFKGIDTHRIDRDVQRPVELPYDVSRVDDAADLLIGNVIVRTTAAYNHPDGPHCRPTGGPYHPEGFGCGFMLTLSETTVYWPGDTDVLAGQEHLDVDVFCPPIGGTFTMDRHKAAELADALAPELVVPVHYDTFAEIEADAEAFVRDCRSRGLTAVQDAEPNPVRLQKDEKRRRGHGQE